MKQLAKSGELAVDVAGAFDASPNSYVLLTPDLLIAGANQAYLDATGSTREAIVGRPLFAAFDSGAGAEAVGNVSQVKASLEKARDSGQRDHLALVRFSVPRRTASGEPVMEERFWSATHTPVLDADGGVIWLLQHTTDITELEQLRRRMETTHVGSSTSALDAMIGGSVLERARIVQEDNDRLAGERNRLVEMFMQAPGFVAVLEGPDHVFQFHNEAYRRLIGPREVEGLTVAAALPEVGQGYIDMLDSVFETGEPVHGKASPVQVPARPGEASRAAFIDFVYQPIRNSEGRIVGVFVQGHDVSEAVEATQRQKLMIDELNHRVKNTLATVQSIAIQTARSHPDPRTFAEGFQARLLALSHTHNLLTRSHWEGAELSAILRHETEAHDAHRLTLNGLPVVLEPAAALSFGMIFHELATNAAKYGALSCPEGRVLVDWSVSDQNRPILHLTWREIGGPPVPPVERKGFGSRLIERNVRHDLAGEFKLDYANDGFNAEFSVPLNRGINS